VLYTESAVALAFDILRFVFKAVRSAREKFLDHNWELNLGHGEDRL